jgi:predicted outer membrane protein
MITPVASNLSTSFEQGAQRTSATLQATSAAGFDLAYVQSQIEIHTQVLATFDDVLLPSVTAPALRTDLTLARADVQSHLTQAQALLIVVQNAPPLEEDAGVAEDAGL